MIKNFRFLVLGFVCLGLSETTLLAHKKKDKPTIKPKGEFFLKPNCYWALSREFIEEMLTRHAALSAIGVSSALGLSLYKKQVHEFVEKNKAAIFGVGVVATLLAYLNKEAILKNYVGLSPHAEDEDSESVDGLSKFSQSGVRVYRPGEIETKFSDVAGLETAKEDMNDLLMFLKDPSMFKNMGAKIPKGVLLSGSPGNGKTLLARALAGEVGCPFLYITASEFIEAIVGIGAARMRHLFAVARDLAPCIIFIDEIDAVGRKRSGHGLGGDTELTQTLNQLLAEMDGFEQEDSPIVVIAATNRIDVLDEALLRPGRFDRKVEISSPFVKDRMKILNVHFKKIKVSHDIDVQKVAQGTKGFSGAELAELVNEAAILAIRENATCVTMYHLDQARDYMLMGREIKGMEIEKDEYWVTAVHEAGHALMHVYLKDATPLYKVTITPRGSALGLTHSVDIKEKYSKVEVEMRAYIKVALGGSVAEEMIFGHRGAGVSSDLEAARSMATAMVMHFGMTEEFKDVSFGEFIHHQYNLPDQISTKLHQAVAKVIRECRTQTEAVLFEHKDKLLELAQMLMDQGTVLGSDVYKLCGIDEPSVVYSLVA